MHLDVAIWSIGSLDENEVWNTVTIPVRHKPCAIVFVTNVVGTSRMRLKKLRWLNKSPACFRLRYRWLCGLWDIMNTEKYTDRINRVSKGNHVTNQWQIVSMIKNLAVPRTPYAWTLVSATSEVNVAAISNGSNLMLSDCVYELSWSKKWWERCRATLNRRKGCW